MIAALLLLVAVMGLSVLSVLFLGRMAGLNRQVPRDPRDGELEQHRQRRQL